MDLEAALLARALRIEESALAEIYDRYSDALYRYAWRLLGSQELAEECVAETFSRFLHALKRGGGPHSNVRAYLYRMAHNWITDFYRRQPPQTICLDPEAHIDEQQDPSKQVGLELERQELRAALAYLTPEQRQVVVLRYLEGWRHAEIAAAMEKPAGAVKALQHRAINALRRLLVIDEIEDEDKVTE